MFIAYITDPNHMRAKWLAFFFIMFCFCVAMTAIGRWLDEHERLRGIRKAAHEERRFTNPKEEMR